MAFATDRKRDEKPARPKPVTAEWLFRAAAHYLERYASSRENLKRVLQRKIDKRIATHDEPPDEEGRAAFAQLVEETLEKFGELKLVDDAAFAESKLRSLRRAGTSTRAAAAKLGAKGVDRETVEATLGRDETDDRTAARRYAERRRLGPHRLRDREARRDRDIAAMVRAGFRYADAKAAVDGAADEE
jgi:regulatory protein